MKNSSSSSNFDPKDSKTFISVEDPSERTSSLSKDDLDTIKSDLTKSFNTFKENMEGEFEKSKKEFESKINEVRKSRDRNIEILAIFVALFTFASLSFQMFANVDKYFWMPLGMLLLGGLMIFCSVVIGINSFITGHNEKSNNKSMSPHLMLGIISIVLVVSGAFFYRAALINQDIEFKACNNLANNILLNKNQNSETLYEIICRQVKEK